MRDFKGLVTGGNENLGVEFKQWMDIQVSKEEPPGAAEQDDGVCPCHLDVHKETAEHVSLQKPDASLSNFRFDLRLRAPAPFGATIQSGPTLSNGVRAFSARGGARSESPA
jgi:hypothetical protein